jgi:hypothetical protein
MAVRVARGLFRLWLVLSAIWILFVITKTWFDITYPTTLTDTEVGLSPGMFDDLIIAGRANSALKFGAALALVPPLLVLALGSALIWAFRGFR